MEGDEGSTEAVIDVDVKEPNMFTKNAQQNKALLWRCIVEVFLHESDTKLERTRTESLREKQLKLLDLPLSPTSLPVYGWIRTFVVTIGGG